MVHSLDAQVCTPGAGCTLKGDTQRQSNRLGKLACPRVNDDRK